MSAATLLAAAMAKKLLVDRILAAGRGLPGDNDVQTALRKIDSIPISSDTLADILKCLDGIIAGEP